MPPNHSKRSRLACMPIGFHREIPKHSTSRRTQPNTRTFGLAVGWRDQVSRLKIPALGILSAMAIFQQLSDFAGVSGFV